MKYHQFTKLCSSFALGTAVLLSACAGPVKEAKAPDTLGSPLPIAAPDSYEEGKNLVTSLIATHSLASIATIVETWTASTDNLRGYCHGLLRHAGAEFAKEKGLVEVPSTVCDYGLVHGLLYGYAEVAKDIDSYVLEVVQLCEKISPTSGPPRDRCIHGIGHGLALVSQGNISVALDACDSLPTSEKYYQCTGGVVMEFGEDHLSAIGWSVGHSAENSPTSISVDADLVATLCDGRDATCHERYWMFVLPPRDMVSGTEDGSLVESTCLRFSGTYELRQCLVGFGALAALLWTIFDIQDGVSYPPDSPEDADIVAKRAVSRCSKHPDLGLCLLGFIPSIASQVYSGQWPYVPDFCSFVSGGDVESCEYAVRSAKDGS